MKLDDEVKLAASINWFLPSIDPKEFNNLVKAEKISRDSAYNAQVKSHNDGVTFWREFNPESGRRIVEFNIARTLCRETWVYLSNDNKIFSIEAAHQQGYHYNELHWEYPGNRYCSANPHFLNEGYPPVFTRFINPLIFSENDLTFRGDWDAEPLLTYQVEKMIDFYNDYTRECFLCPNDSLIKWFNDKWSESHSDYARIDFKEDSFGGWRGAYRREQQQKERDEVIESARQRHEESQAAYLKAQEAHKEAIKDLRRNYLRRKQINTKPAEIMAAVQKMKDYANH